MHFLTSHLGGFFVAQKEVKIMERRIPLITDYQGIVDPEERRQAISHSKQEKSTGENAVYSEKYHNYSGDSVFVQLDEQGNWQSDFFELSR
jgi:hypothetical protein